MQVEDILVQLPNKHPEARGDIMEVKSDLFQVATQVQQKQQAQIYLEGVVDTNRRVTAAEASISDFTVNINT
jgi:hypothetical protein